MHFFGVPKKHLTQFWHAVLLPQHGATMFDCSQIVSRTPDTREVQLALAVQMEQLHLAENKVPRNI